MVQTQMPEWTQMMANRRRVMNRLARTLLVLLSLSLAAAAQPKKWRGTWSATVGSGGRAFRGTWDATLGHDPDTVLGSWTVTDQAGATVATGTWAARKGEKAWKGSWQARAGSGQLFSGTWRAQSQLPASTPFSELFEFALTKIASGTWQIGTAYSGTWSIRAYPRQ
jgi:hypothetical protein